MSGIPFYGEELYEYDAESPIDGAIIIALEKDSETGKVNLVQKTLLPHKLRLRKLVMDILTAVDNRDNYPEDPVEFELKMITTEQDLQRILSEFKNDQSRAD